MYIYEFVVLSKKNMETDRALQQTAILVAAMTSTPIQCLSLKLWCRVGQKLTVLNIMLKT